MKQEGQDIAFGYDVDIPNNTVSVQLAQPLSLINETVLYMRGVAVGIAVENGMPISTLKVEFVSWTAFMDRNKRYSNHTCDDTCCQYCSCALSSIEIKQAREDGTLCNICQGSHIAPNNQ